MSDAPTHKYMTVLRKEVRYRTALIRVPISASWKAIKAALETEPITDWACDVALSGTDSVRDASDGELLAMCTKAVELEIPHE